MATSEAVKIQRSKEREAMAALAVKVLTHPVLMAVAGLLTIEYYQGHDEVVAVPKIQKSGVIAYEQVIQRRPGDGFVGSVAGSTVEGGLVAYLAAEALKEGVAAVAALR